MNHIEDLFGYNQDTSERKIEFTLLQILKLLSPNGNWNVDSKAGKGRCDIVSDKYKIVIEVKSLGNYKPMIQKEQVFKYLKELSDPFRDKNKFWRGFLTNGIRWTGWEYNQIEKEFNLIYPNKGFNTTDSLKFFLKETVLQEQRAGLRIPEEQNLLKSCFNPRYIECKNLLKTEYRKQSFRTKIALWVTILKGTGVLPSYQNNTIDIGDHETQITFCQHSFIVIVARLIIAQMDNPKNNIENYIAVVSEGFQSWLIQSNDGLEIIKKLIQDIKGYDWYNTSKDILKHLYHGLIESHKRYEFGEYYTPDTLAKRVTDKVLDNDWLDQQIIMAHDVITSKRKNEYGLGVLDPACGSGTFLFQAAMRIRERVYSAHEDKADKTSEIIIKLIHGIDVHPIAVEMSKATLRTVLPEAINSNEYKICLGSAMQEQTPVAYNKIIGYTIENRNPNYSISLGNTLYKHPEFYRILERTIYEVVNKRDTFVSIVDKVKSSLKIRNIDDIEYERFCSDLEETILEHGDHVWLWFILNNMYIKEISNNKVSRIIGNPPWLTIRKLDDKQRSRRIKYIAVNEGVYTTTTGPNTEVDLATAFTTRVTNLYLSKDGVYGWVLPISAMIGQDWEKWRTGDWENSSIKHSEMWDLSIVKPALFLNQKKTPMRQKPCVVIGEKSSSKQKIRGTKKYIYSGNYYKQYSRKEIAYLRKNPSCYSDLFRYGINYSPYCYYQVSDRTEIDDNLCRIIVFKSKKNQWKDCGIDGIVEKEVLHPVMTSNCFNNKAYTISNWIIAPISETGSFLLENMASRKEHFPYLHKYWVKCNEQYRSRKKPNQPSSIEFSYNYHARVKSEFKKIRNFEKDALNKKIKVVYNNSGNNLNAVAITPNILVNNTLYQCFCESELEAKYLVNVINAPIMQSIWNATRTAQGHFSNNPFKCVPLPKFDINNDVHRKVATPPL